ncbi:N-terminal nucleophile aminohydrolase, partial [Fragilariopsis cylindrus CCMP1102]
KTGTTIAGCVVIDTQTNQQYVILGADTRATEGTIVADKRCDKIHKLASNCRCCGAGTSADLDKVTRQVDENNNNELLWMKSVSIDVLCNMFQDTLFKSKGQLGANLILGGVWNGKASLRAIHPHGSADIDLPFTALGSGGLAAISVLEDGYNSCHSSVEDGIKLVQRAILAGIQNDLGSGSQVDICII